MTVRSDKVELVIEAKDEASRVLRELFGNGAEVIAEMRAEVEALQKQYAELVGVQRGQSNTVNELSAGNRELTDELQEQAERAKELYKIELELGSRAASTEKERIDLARQGLAMEREATLAHADAMGVTEEQRKALDSLFLRLDMQIQAQAEANAETEAGARATTTLSTATRAAAFATGVFEKALVSVKRALFIAPLVAVFNELLGTMGSVVDEMLDFGEASDLAAEKQERLTRSLDASREAMERIQQLNFARTLPGAGDQRSDRIGLLDTALGRVRDPTQFPNGISAKELLDIAGPLDLTLLQGYQAELKKRDDLVRGLLDQGRFGELVRLTGVRFSGQVSDSRDVAEFRKAVLDSVTQSVLISREEAISALERKRFELRDRTGTPSGFGGPTGPAFLGLEGLSIADLPPGMALSILPTPAELAEMMQAEVVRMQSVQIRNLVNAGLMMSQDGLGGLLGVPSLLGIGATPDAAAIAVEQARLSGIAKARQDQLRDEEQLASFTAERLSLMGQLELSHEEQVELLQMQTDAQRQAVEMAQQAGQITGEQARTLLDLIDRLQAQGLARLRSGSVFGGGSMFDPLFDPIASGNQQLRQAVDALDDRGVASLADALKQTAINFDDAGVAAQAFGRSVVNALLDIAAQWAALQVISSLFGGVASFGNPSSGPFSTTPPPGAPTGGGLDVTFPSGGSSGILPSTFGGGGSGGARPVQITVNVHMPVNAIDSRDFKARVSEISRHVGDTVARELDSNAGLKGATRRIARSAG